VLLDIRQGQAMDGYEVCRRIREFSTLPIIMLTAKAREKDLLQGFEVGTDDYLTKPFSSKELVVRVQAAIRRAQSTGSMVSSTVNCGNLKINLARRTVEVGASVVSLTRTEYKLLCQLAMNPNRVMLHEELLTEVWGPEYRNDVDYLRAYVRYLRRKLEADPTNPQYILTSPGQGYVLNCPEEDDADSGE
jgi:two-component system KDP operon response regulator KdpE